MRFIILGASIPEEESFGSDLDQKVIELENTLSIYATEITLLKSALSNALSRLSVVEDELKKVNTTGKTKKGKIIYFLIIKSIITIA